MVRPIRGRMIATMTQSSKHPLEQLKENAAKWGCDITDEAFAVRMDENDTLRRFRDEFYYPKKKDLPGIDESLKACEEESVYLCGNSLGLLPKKARKYVEDEMDKWAAMGVHGHFHGEQPWALCDEVILHHMAEIVAPAFPYNRLVWFAGSKPEEVAIMNGLTVNQHLLLISFYRPTPTRHKILLEKHAFPSDHYAIESQIRLRGYDPATSMICLAPRKGEELIRMEDVLATIEKEGDSIAVIMLPGVQYYTGQVFDMPTITKAGHAKGCYVGFDLAHSVGNIESPLHDWDLDFACWCSYKYLNSGAGGIAGIFIHERFANNDFPKLHGWWSHKMDTRFKMDNVLDTPPGASAYRISNPSMFMCASLKGCLEVHTEAGMPALRAKSKLLTGYLEYMLKLYYPKHTEGNKSTVSADAPYVDIITPDDPDKRGCQLSVMFSVPIKHVFAELSKRGVVLDKREPNVLRVAPTPLYNSFHDVYKFVHQLGDALKLAHEADKNLSRDG